MKTNHDSETLAEGKQVITTCAFIHHNFDGVEKVFLPKRAATKKFLPNVFELPGGHIDFGEDLKEGLKREIKEEFGMSIEVGDCFYAFTYTNHIKKSHSVEIIFLAKFTDPIENIQINPEDHSEYKWFTESEIKHAFTENKQEDDQEFQAINKGFSLLKNATHL